MNPTESPATISGRVLLRSLLMVYVADQLVLLLHEISHGAAAILVGGSFPLLTIQLNSAHVVYLLPNESAAWKHGVVLIMGYVVTLAIATAGWRVAAKRGPSGGATFMVFLPVVAASRILTGSGVLRPWDRSFGELDKALLLLHCPPMWHYAIKVIGLGSGLLILAVAARSLWQTSGKLLSCGGGAGDSACVSGSELLPQAASGLIGRSLSEPNRRVKALGFLSRAGMLVAPCALLAALESIALRLLAPVCGCSIANSPAPLWIPLTVAVTAFCTALLGVSPAAGASPVRRPGLQWRSDLLLAVSAGICICCQIYIFGLDSKRPKGLFIDSRESVVASCNIEVQVVEDGRAARVLLRMRPFDQQHELLWERVQQREPKTWNHYEDFASRHAARMTGASSCRLISRHTDRSAPFYTGANWSIGARVVELRCDFPPASDGTSGENRTFRMEDVWRSGENGYIDSITFSAEEGKKIIKIDTDPATSGLPFPVSDRAVRWENDSLAEAFRTARITVGSRSSPRNVDVR